MRDIKLRAWDKQTGDWLELYEEDQITQWYNPRCDIYRAFFDKHVSLMLCTGLKDRDGREIYEGDIVKLHIPDETKTPYISPVYFDYRGAIVKQHPAHMQMGLDYYRSLSDYCTYGFDEESDIYCKVIGNIWENYDLLESEDDVNE